jgi:hypothetical protein
MMFLYLRGANREIKPNDLSSNSKILKQQSIGVLNHALRVLSVISSGIVLHWDLWIGHESQCSAGIDVH